MIHKGHGENYDAARRDLTRNKLATMPVLAGPLPSPTTPEELDGVVRNLVAGVLNRLIEINTIMLKPPAGITEEYCDAVRLAALEGFVNAHAVLESTYPKAGDVPDGAGTTAGDLMRIQRKGESLKGATFSLHIPRMERKKDPEAK